MNISESDFQYMLECQERDIATLLVEEHHMTIHQALDILYASDTYKALQSPRYVFSYLYEEMKTGRMTT